MATAQQLTSLAVGLRESGHDVTVITSDRGYDEQSLRFSKRETWRGIQIIRIPSLALGKAARWRRALNFFSFLFSSAFRLLLLPGFDCVVALTSPPLISLLGVVFTKLKGGRFFFWVMDLNPDEAIAAGWLRPGSITTKMLSHLLNYSLRHSERVIVLDRFMKQRVEAKNIPADRIEIISPWALDDAVCYDREGREAFRARRGLAEKFVVMYSGNHSPCHPLDTLLKAAQQLAIRDDIVFCFVGGGSEQVKVRQFASTHDLNNVLCLPYQAIGELSGSLSAADLHTAVMGDAFVGIVHPCKVYNIMQLGIPLLYIGPEKSSIADLAVQAAKNGLRYKIYQSRHGDVSTVVESIEAAFLGRQNGEAPAGTEFARRFSAGKLLSQMINLLEARTLKSELEVVEQGVMSTEY